MSEILKENTNRARTLLESISTLPPDRYEIGKEEGYTNGYTDGRCSLDILPNIELAPWGAYYGKVLDSFGDQRLILLFTLKKGKTVPSGSLGHIRQPLTGGTTAAWVVSGGEYKTVYRTIELIPSEYRSSLLGCYPGTKETWDAFMDAFEVRAELIQEEI